MTSHPSPKLIEEPRDSESLFVEHYEWLRSWAEQLTQGHRTEAEDLVQDLYVRFVQSRTPRDFSSEDALRGYLYSALKNLWISRGLRRGRDAVSGLVTVDFDSLEFALASVDRSQLFQVRSDLAAICEYACLRRATHRAAAALILRFFLGYLPTEVMALLLVSRSHLDTLIDTARLEAKAYMTRPRVLRFMDRARKAPEFPRSLPEQPIAMFTELHHRIFSDTEGECLSSTALHERYSQRTRSGFSGPEIAHLSSCSWCLRKACKILNLADQLLTGDSSHDSHDDDTPPDHKPATPGVDQLHRRQREVFEHRPKKIQLVVDGEVRSVQTITSVSSKLQITLPPLAKPRFVEILSEQGLGLLYVDLDQNPIDRPSFLQATAQFSDDRLLSVSVCPSSGTTVVDVTYLDPLLKSDEQSVDLQSVTPVEELKGTVSRADQNAEGSHFTRLWRFLKEHKGSVGILALAVCSLPILAWLLRIAPHAENPLRDPHVILSDAVQKTFAGVPLHGAIHSTFSMEIQSQHGNLIESAWIDSLRSTDLPKARIQIKESGGTVLSNHSIDSKGQSIEFIRRNRLPRIVQMSFLQDRVWEHPPDAGDFARLSQGGPPLQVARSPEGYDISFRHRHVPGHRDIVAGHLIISTSTHRPVSETLQSESDTGTVEYRFRETAYEVLGPEQVSDDDFLPAPNSSAATKIPSGVSSASTLLDLLELVQGQSESTREAINIDRNSTNEISMDGVLPTETDKQSLMQSVSTLPGSREIHADLHTNDEASSQRSPSGEISVEEGVASTSMPLSDFLKSQIQHRSANDQELIAGVLGISHLVVTNSERLHREAWELNQTGVNDFRASEIDGMSRSERLRWLGLLNSHVQSCREKMTYLASILETQPDKAKPFDMGYPNLQQLRLGLTAFLHDAERLDNLVTAGFALAPQPTSSRVTEEEIVMQLRVVETGVAKLDATVTRLRQTSP